MNCKPGDMARIVEPAPRYAVDHIVEVVRAAAPEDVASVVAFDRRYAQDFLWECKSVAGMRGVNQQGQRDYFFPGHDVWVPDAWLRPLRDPGDGARDQMLRPLPQPVEA